MAPTCPPNSFPGRLPVLLLVSGGLLLGIFGGAGCAAVSVPAEKPAPARLLVRNLTDYVWRLVLANPADGRLVDEEVAPRTEKTIDVAGADYEITQSIAAGNPAGDLARRFPCRLESGRTYHWRLATLLSGDARP